MRSLGGQSLKDLPRDESDDGTPAEFEATYADGSVQTICSLPDGLEDLAIVGRHANWDALSLLLDLACGVASLIDNFDILEIRVLTEITIRMTRAN